KDGVANHVELPDLDVGHELGEAEGRDVVEVKEVVVLEVVPQDGRPDDERGEDRKEGPQGNGPTGDGVRWHVRRASGTAGTAMPLSISAAYSPGAGLSSRPTVRRVVSHEQERVDRRGRRRRLRDRRPEAVADHARGGRLLGAMVRTLPGPRAVAG